MFYIHSLPATLHPSGAPAIGIFADKLYEQPMMWIRKVEPHIVVEFTKGPVMRKQTVLAYREALAWIQSIFFNPQRDELAYFDLIAVQTAKLSEAILPGNLQIPGPHMDADGVWCCPGCENLGEEPVGDDLCLHPDSPVKPGRVHGGVKPFTCPYFPELIP